jgi:Ca2+-dependent lipid-binding protein
VQKWSQTTLSHKILDCINMGVLTVVLEKVTHLTDGDGVGRSDPYLKFELKKDKLLFDKNYGHKKSSKKRNTLNPEYNEVFVFEDVPTMNNMVLEVDIMDNDVGLDDRIGSVDINLEQYHLNDTPQEVQVVAPTKKGGSPTVFLKLAYINAK